MGYIHALAHDKFCQKVIQILFYPKKHQDQAVHSSFAIYFFQTSTNASREQLNVHRSAQKHLTRTNVLAMKDINLMKMDLHVEVVIFAKEFCQCGIKIFTKRNIQPL